MDELAARMELVAAVKRLDQLGLNVNSSGNLSVRLADGVLVTPSGIQAHDTTVDDLYAYLLIPHESVLGKDAQKRLKVLMEHSDLGSGFRLP